MHRHPLEDCQNEYCLESNCFIGKKNRQQIIDDSTHRFQFSVASVPEPPLSPFNNKFIFRMVAYAKYYNIRRINITFYEDGTLSFDELPRDCR